MKRKFSRRKIILLFLLTAVVGGIPGYYYGVYRPARQAAAAEAAKKLSAGNGDMDRTFRVRRDDLPIGLLLGGYVNASKKHKLALQANYGTKLLWAVEENSRVKAGDVLAKFETDALEIQIENQEIELDNLIKELDLAIESEKIQLSSNAADLQSAEENLLQTEDALRKYRRFERISQRDTLEQAITTAEESLETAVANYDKVRDSEPSTTNDEDPAEKKRREMKSAQAAIEKAEKELSKAEDNRKVFRRFDHPSKTTRLTNAFEQAKLNLRRVRISTSSKAIQQKRSIENYKRRIWRTREQLERYQTYMKQMQLVAPVDGVVIYGDADKVWDKLELKEGMDVGKGRVLITIPEMSNLIVEFELPEQSRAKVNIGDKVNIFPDSLPGTKFTGKVMHIDTLPVNQVSWDGSSPKVYKSKIKLDAQSPLLVNGMSVKLNIVTKIIPQTLFIPVEAVFEDGDRFFVYRSTLTGPEEVDVVIGESNDNFVQIKSGLEEDETVYLYRPYQKSKDAQ